MTETDPETAATSVRRASGGLVLRQLRIISGLTLLTYVTFHLINAALGLVSTEWMDAARPYLTSIWRMVPLGILLGLALITHFLLGLWAIYQRPTLRTTPQDMVQIATAVCIMPLLALHAVAPLEMAQLGQPLTYDLSIKFMWIFDPRLGLAQVVLLSVVWVHGCAGFFTWLRAKPGAQLWLAWLYPVALAIPVLALLGFSEAGRRALAEAAPQAALGAGAAGGYGAPVQTTQAPGASGYGAGGYFAPATSDAYGRAGGYGAPSGAPSGATSGSSGQDGYGGGYGDGYGTSATPAANAPDTPRITPQDMARIMDIRDAIIWGSVLLILVAFAGRLLRRIVQPRRQVHVDCAPDGFDSKGGLSLLDMFRRAGRPHAAVCSGRGRCGTCAVRVVRSDYPLPAPSLLERKTLLFLGAGPDVRLACQIRPEGGGIDVVPMFPPDYGYRVEEGAEPAPDPAERPDDGEVPA